MAKDITGTNLSANASANVREPYHNVNVKWDGTNAINESAYLISASGEQRIADPAQGLASFGAGVISTCQIVLDNSTGRFSPDNSGGALYADIQNTKGVGSEVRVNLGFTDATNGNETVRIFTGHIDSVSHNAPYSPWVTLSCIDKGQKVIEHRVSTGLYQDRFVDQIFDDLFDTTPVVARSGGTPSVDLADQSFQSGFMRVPFAWLEQEDIYRQLQLLAQADGGFFYIDGDGVYVYENIYNMLTDTDQSTSVIGFDLDESMYQGVSVSYSEQEIYNTINVSWQPRRAGANIELFKSDRVWTVPANTTKTFTARYRFAALSIDPLVAGEHYFAVSSGGVDMSSNVTITPTLYAQSADISIQNTSTLYDAEIRPFIITGVPLIGGPSETFTTDATDSAIGDPTTGLVKRKEMGTNQTTGIQNVYIQTEQQAEVIAYLTLDRSKNPRKAPTLTAVPAVPWLEPLDKVTVDSTNQSWTAEEFNLTGIAWDYQVNPRRYEQTLTMLESSSFFPYTTAQYFIINTDAPSAGTSDRLFY